MTIKEALKVLRKEYICRTSESCPDSIFEGTCEGRGLYDDADTITEALKTVLDVFGNGSEIPNSSGDLISRQAAIDALNVERLTITGETSAKAVYNYIFMVIGKLKSLPPVQAEQKITHCENCKHKHLEKDVWTCPFGLPGGPKFFCGYGSDNE